MLLSLFQRGADAFELGKPGGQRLGIFPHVGHDGAEHHGAAQCRQHIARFDDKGGRRILLQPLQAGEQGGEFLLLASPDRCG